MTADGQGIDAHEQIDPLFAARLSSNRDAAAQRLKNNDQAIVRAKEDKQEKHIVAFDRNHLV